MHHFLRIFQFAYPYLRPYLPRMIGGMVCGILYGLSHATFIGLTKIVITLLAAGSDTSQLAPPALPSWVSPSLTSLFNTTYTHLIDLLPKMGEPLSWPAIVGGLLILPVLVAIRSTFGYLSNYLTSWVSERTARDLRCAMLEKLQSLSHDFYNKSKPGDLMTRVHGDTMAIESCFGNGFADLIKGPVTLLSVLATLVFLDWKLALVGLVFLPLTLVPITQLGRKMRRASESSTKHLIHQTNMLLESLSSIRMVKAFGLEQQQLDKFRDQQGRLVHYNMKRVQARELVNPAIEFISSFGLGALILFVVWSQTSLADVGAFIMALLLVASPIKKLARVHVLIKQTSVSVDRLTEIENLVPTIRDPADPRPLPGFNHSLSFHNVRFGYGSGDVLQNISFSLARGRKLGIAGESGSGKSSLVNLLFRFYDPLDGSIQLDGTDIRHLRLADLRGTMALVSQDIVLFDDTVRGNIAAGKQNATETEIIAAARAASAHDFITSLPDGYDTLIGERGILLSGGQRQRLSIARAFVRNAPILVLDEATASLDSHAEQEVQQAIEKLSESRTVICVAHRLSTLRSMDEILVLAKGRIVEHGSYSGLLQANGPFAALARKQDLVP